MHPPAAYGFGLVAMGTNVTTLALLVPAVREVAVADVGVVVKGASAALLVALACIPAWAPLALVAGAPGAGKRYLTGVQRVIDRYGRAALMLAFAAAGAYLVGRGVLGVLHV